MGVRCFIAMERLRIRICRTFAYIGSHHHDADEPFSEYLLDDNIHKKFVLLDLVVDIQEHQQLFEQKSHIIYIIITQKYLGSTYVNLPSTPILATNSFSLASSFGL